MTKPLGLQIGAVTFEYSLGFAKDLGDWFCESAVQMVIDVIIWRNNRASFLL